MSETYVTIHLWDSMWGAVRSPILWALRIIDVAHAVVAGVSGRRSGVPKN